jgi:hypothetical protein
MKKLKSFENFVNEDLHRSQDDPSANISGIKSTKWDNINLTDEEIRFLIFIYNNFDTGGPMANTKNWKNITFSHGKNMMNKVIGNRYKKLKEEEVIPIAQGILDKMNGINEIP